MSGKRLAFLDGLRAIAVILVFLTHSTEKFVDVAATGHWIAALAHGLDFGRVGVVVFFAISGFLIPSSLRGGQTDGVVRFAIGRFFRLFPAFWVSVPLSLLTQHWLIGTRIDHFDTLLNATMLPRLFGAPMVNGAYWTLEVELFFYLACAFLFIGGLLRNGFVLCALSLGCGFLFYTSQQPMFDGRLNPDLSGDAFFFWLHVSIMFWGAACRQLWDGERLGRPAALMFWIFTGYLMAYRPLGLATHLLIRHDLSPAIAAQAIGWTSGYSGAMWIFAILVFLRPLHSRLLAWIGRISYSFYLLHGAAIYFVLWLAQRYAAGRGFDMLVYIAVSFLLTLAISQVSFRAIEAPAIALGRRLSAAVLARLGWGAEPRYGA